VRNSVVHNTGGRPGDTDSTSFFNFNQQNQQQQQPQQAPSQFSPASTAFSNQPFQNFQQPRFQSRPSPASSFGGQQQQQQRPSFNQGGQGSNGNFFSVFNPASFASPATRNQRAIDSKHQDKKDGGSYQRIEYHFPTPEFGGFKPVDHRYPAARSDEESDNENYVYYDNEADYDAAGLELVSSASERSLGDYHDSYAYERLREDPRLERLAKARLTTQRKTKAAAEKKKESNNRRQQQQYDDEFEVGLEDYEYYYDDSDYSVGSAAADKRSSRRRNSESSSSISDVRVRSRMNEILERALEKVYYAEKLVENAQK
jgi:hypothetical protein